MTANKTESAGTDIKEAAPLNVGQPQGINLDATADAPLHNPSLIAAEMRAQVENTRRKTLLLSAINDIPQYSGSTLEEPLAVNLSDQGKLAKLIRQLGAVERALAVGSTILGEAAYDTRL